MKQYYDNLRLLLFTFVAGISVQTMAQLDNDKAALRDSLLAEMDSVEISLLTCSPHEEIYSVYGHTSIRYKNFRRNEDLAFNWGVFNPKVPYFAVNFMRGHTDYELGAYDFDIFCKEYKHWGSQVVEQVIDLTPEEKLNVVSALMNNLRPENRFYRYNFFFDNCATRPRNVIEQCLNSQVKYVDRQDYTPTFREIIHFCTRNHPWWAFANDLLLGFKADQRTTLREQEFLPDNLRYDFDRAQLATTEGYKPLVKERRVAVTPGVQTIRQDFPLAPTECALLMLLVSVVVAGLEWRRNKTYVWWDALWMVFTALPGIVLVLMLFSLHPATSTNLQVLVFNPLPFFFLPSVLRRRSTRWWNCSLVLVALFLLGSFVQDYAEGMEILALCLLVRVLVNRKLAK